MIQWKIYVKFLFSENCYNNVLCIIQIVMCSNTPIDPIMTVDVRKDDILFSVSVVKAGGTHTFPTRPDDASHLSYRLNWGQLSLYEYKFKVEFVFVHQSYSMKRELHYLRPSVFSLHLSNQLFGLLSFCCWHCRQQQVCVTERHGHGWQQTDLW